MTTKVHHGDCLDVMAGMEEDSVDAVVTDPPYGLEFMGKEWDRLQGGFSEPQGDGSWAALHNTSRKGFDGYGPLPNYTQPTANVRCPDCGNWRDGRDPNKPNRRKGYRCICGGVQREQRQSVALGMQQWHQAWAEAALRVLKPGGHLVAFGGTRTHHRLWCALEDAGFEVRDTLCWLYGSGFPKNLDVSKAIDKAAGAEREVVGSKLGRPGVSRDGSNQGRESWRRLEDRADRQPPTLDLSAPATDAARQWDGWGTALKPAWEIVTLARKPYPAEGGRGIIAESLTRLEAQLWSLLPAKAAEESFGLSPSAYAEACGFAQWTAAERSNTRADLCGQMDTSRFVSVLTSCLNTVLSWSNTLAALSNPPNTSTTEAETEQTIDWRTLSSCVSGLTPHSIIEAEMKAPGSRCAVLLAARYLNAVVVRQNATLELSALAPAISNGQARCQAEAAQGFSPAWEPIVLARKPLVGTVAANVQAHGTGALNVDGCRVGTTDSLGGGGATTPAAEGWDRPFRHDPDAVRRHHEATVGKVAHAEAVGRWPANVVLDEEAAAMLDAQSGEKMHGAGFAMERSHMRSTVPPGEHCYRGPEVPLNRYGDSGGASRFFYCAKASRAERGNGNNHPTVKPLALMRWLVRLVTPPGGLILDPFVGSGTTALAAVAEGFRCIGIDSDAGYCELALKRLAQAQPALVCS